ncbi:MAG TPA: hypothetical protein VIK45_16785 [Candidatus Dormibacteraeota bacterium]
MSWLSGLLNRRRRPSGAPASAAPARASGHDWAALPPIQRTAADLELTAPALEFARELPGPHGQRLMLQPLGHARTPEAPQGLVAGLASAVPVQRYSGRETFVFRPVQRTPRWHGGEADADSWPDAYQEAPELPAAAYPGPLDGASVDPVADMPTDAQGAPLAEGLPPVQAPREVPAVAPQRHPQPLTASRLVEAPSPPPALLLAAAGPPGQLAFEAERKTATAMEATAEGAPALAVAPVPAMPAPVVQTSSSYASSPTSPLRLNLGQSRRRGLGPPLASAPTAVQLTASEPASAPGPSSEAPATGATGEDAPGDPAAAAGLEESSPGPTEPAKQAQAAEPAQPASVQRSTAEAEAPELPQLPLASSPAASGGERAISESAVGQQPPGQPGVIQTAATDAVRSVAVASPIVRVQRSRQSVDLGPPARPASSATADLRLAPGGRSSSPALSSAGDSTSDAAANSPAAPALDWPEPSAPEPASVVTASEAAPEAELDSAPIDLGTPTVAAEPPQVQRTGPELPLAPVHHPSGQQEPTAAAEVDFSPIRPLEVASLGIQRWTPPAPVNARPRESGPATALHGAALPKVQRLAGPNLGPTTGVTPATSIAGPTAQQATDSSTPPDPGASASLPLATARGLTAAVPLPLATLAQRTVASGHLAQAPAGTPPAGFPLPAAAGSALAGAAADASGVPVAPQPAELPLAPAAGRVPATFRRVQTLSEARVEPAWPSGAAGPAAGQEWSAPSSPEPAAAAMAPGGAWTGGLSAQRAAEDAPAPAPSAGAPPAAGAAGAHGGGAAPSEGELDDLAVRLYDRLRSRLRLELLIDRERAGLITDLR